MSNELCLVIGFILGVVVTGLAILLPLYFLYSTWKIGYTKALEFLQGEVITASSAFYAAVGMKAEVEMFREDMRDDDDEDEDREDEMPRKW